MSDLGKQHWVKGNNLIYEGQVDEGIAECRKSIKIDPDNAVAHFSLSLGLRLKGLFEAEIAELQEAVRLDPIKAVFRLELGLILFNMGRFEEAVPELAKGLRGKPDHVRANYALATSLYRMGQRNEACERYWKVIELDLDNSEGLKADAYFGSGSVLACQGHWDAALDKYDQARRINPCLPGLRRACALVYLDQRRFGKALRALLPSR